MIEPCRQWVKMNSLLTVYVCKFEGTQNGSKHFIKSHLKVYSLLFERKWPAEHGQELQQQNQMFSQSI